MKVFLNIDRSLSIQFGTARFEKNIYEISIDFDIFIFLYSIFAGKSPQ